ncbi:MAG: YcxB family protein [Verrucomicrobiaceae bacterium]|nr:YcxB family protein [Verrucomicrobiaceae bacterium]
MSEEITAKVTFDQPTMLAGYRWHVRASWIYRTIRAILLVMVVASMVSFVVTRISPEARGYLVYITIFLIAYWPLVLFLQKVLFISNLKSSPLFGTQIACSIADTGLGVDSIAFRGTYFWNAFHKTATTTEGVLLYQQKLLFIWLPKTAFTSEADYTRFLDLLAAKTKHSKLT